MLIDRGLGEIPARGGGRRGHVRALGAARAHRMVPGRHDLVADPGRVYEERMLTDLEDTAEHIVCLCEELDSGQGAGYTGRDRVR